MILYLDTSALVKLYVDEPGRERVEAAVRNAERIATVRVTYAEARAAFARQRRERAITARDLRTLVRALDEDWASLAVVEVTEASVRAAGDLAERHALFVAAYQAKSDVKLVDQQWRRDLQTRLPAIGAAARKRCRAATSPVRR